VLGLDPLYAHVVCAEVDRLTDIEVLKLPKDTVGAVHAP
jgi:hypothetical protein